MPRSYANSSSAMASGSDGGACGATPQGLPIPTIPSPSCTLRLFTAIIIGSMLDREQAWNLLCEYTKSEGLRKHALAVETCVAAYVRKSAEDEHKWSLPALLHDFDWEIHPTLEEHPQKGEPILAERGVPEEIRRA